LSTNLELRRHPQGPRKKEFR